MYNEYKGRVEDDSSSEENDSRGGNILWRGKVLLRNEPQNVFLEVERQDEKELTATAIPHSRHAKKLQAEEVQTQKKKEW